MDAPVDPLRLPYMKLKRWIQQNELVSKEELAKCRTPGNMLQALLDAGKYPLTVQQATEIRETLEEEDKMSAETASARGPDMNALYDSIKIKQISDPVASITADVPRRAGTGPKPSAPKSLSLTCVVRLDPLRGD